LSRLKLYLFGSPRIEVDGQAAVVDTRKATALLAYLAVTEKTHQRDTLAALLWPEYDQTSARAALRRTLSTLNRALNGAHLEITRETIGLAPASNRWIDAIEFRRLLSQISISANSIHGHAANEICPRCMVTLENAAHLYLEPFMAGFSLRDSASFEEWQFFQEETLRRELSGVLEKLVFGLQANQRFEEAIQISRRWLSLDSLQEEAHRQLMVLYYQTGQHSAALRQYQQCARILNEELGVPPLEETTNLYQAILTHAPLPQVNGRLHFIKEDTNGNRLVGHNLAIPLQPQADEPPAKPITRPLIGRTVELQRMIQVFQSMAREDSSARGIFVSLTGEAGIGKSRLAEEFIEFSRSHGAHVAIARCYSGESGLAYAPLIHALSFLLSQPGAAVRLKSLASTTLAEAARLCPEIRDLIPALPEVAPITDGAHMQFFDALRQTLQALLVGPIPGILFLDDLHWADTATLRLVTFLAHRLSEMPLILLAAWRTENSEIVQGLELLAGEMARSELCERFELDRLNPEEVIELVRAYPGSPGTQQELLGKRLYQESEGLPFIAIEYLAALSVQKSPADPAAWEMPASVRDLLRSHLSGLDSTARQLLSTAAVIGRSFDYNTLREASGRSENETVDGLDSLLQTGLIADQTRRDDDSGAYSSPAAAPAPAVTLSYDFTHEKLRELVYYEETSQARRLLLHRRIAEVIARQHYNRPDFAGLAAFHFAQARLPEQAADYHRMAGEHARQLFANVEALSHFQAALAAGHPDKSELFEAIGDLQTLRGEYSAALACYRSAVEYCQPDCIAGLEHKIGNLHQRLGDWEQADIHYRASLAASGDSAQDLSLKVHLYADRSLTAYSRGDLGCAQELAEQALSLAESSADPYARAQVNNMLGMLARARGETAAAITHLEASLSDAKTLHDPLAQIAALNNLALVYRERPASSPEPTQSQHLERAVQLTHQALNLCKKRGDRHHEAALHNNLADLLHKLGREEEAMVQLKQAVVIFAEIHATMNLEGDAVISPDASFPAEIWKLTEW
jgi:DNA-binding SARP family transcriptional activator